MYYTGVDRSLATLLFASGLGLLGCCAGVVELIQGRQDSSVFFRVGYAPLVLHLNDLSNADLMYMNGALCGSTCRCTSVQCCPKLRAAGSPMVHI